MVPAEQMQQPMAGQKQQFLLQRMAVLRGLALSGGNGNHDVAQLNGQALQGLRGIFFLLTMPTMDWLRLRGPMAAARVRGGCDSLGWRRCNYGSARRRPRDVEADAESRRTQK